MSPSEQEPKAWNIGDSQFTAYPDVGARLAEWRYKGQILIQWPESAPTNLAKVRGGNPILFPFAARTFAHQQEGQWIWNNQQRPMPRHGFARGGRFETTIQANGFTSTLIATEEDQKAYPFDYRFSVTYIFNANGFVVDLSLKNQGSQPIPWSAGHHFYFALPAERREQTKLDIAAHKAWHHQSDGSLKEAKLDGHQHTFSDPNMVDRIHTHIRTQPIRFGPIADNISIEMNYEGDFADKDWVSVVTWTENASSPFYCVEPWMGPPNSPTHGHGIASVAPGSTNAFRVIVTAA